MYPKTATRSFALKRLVAAAALMVAGHAFAGDFLAEIGVGYGSGGNIDVNDRGHRDSLLLNGAFGYRFDTNFGVRALLITDADPVRGFDEYDRSFDDFLGVQATVYVPVAQQLKMMGGLGLGQTRLDDGGFGDRGHQTVGDGVVSAGLQYQFSRHYAMELHADYLTHTHESSIGVTFQIPF